MQRNALFVGGLFLFISLAGCFGDDGDGGSNGVERDCGVKQAKMVITSSTNADVPLYTLNDGEREMRVVAMGFQGGDGNPTDLEVPNPQLRLMECQTLELTIENLNDLPHTFHLHGGLVDWDMDGVPFLSQLPIHKGISKTYVFEDLKAGTYWYHCHVDVAHHIDLGMYGAFIVEEWEPAVDYDEDLEEHVLMLDEWDNCHIHGGIDPTANREETGGFDDETSCNERKFQDYYAQNGVFQNVRSPLCEQDGLPQQVYDQLNCDAHGTPPPDQSIRTWYPMTFPLYKPEYNTFTINGKAFPDTKPVLFEEGKTYRMRFINVGEEWHSLHIHGHNMQVVYRDGYLLDSPFTVDTLGIGPGERYDVLVTADAPGFWAFHDHVALNVMNDHMSPGGMFTLIGYEGFAESLDAGLVDQLGLQVAPDMRSIELLDFTHAYHEKHSDGHDHGSADATPMRMRSTDAGTVISSF